MSPRLLLRADGWSHDRGARAGELRDPRRPKLASVCRSTRRRVGGVPENYFDVWVAQRYEVLWPHLFDPQVVEPSGELPC